MLAPGAMVQRISLVELAAAAEASLAASCIAVTKAALRRYTQALVY